MGVVSETLVCRVNTSHICRTLLTQRKLPSRIMSMLVLALIHVTTALPSPGMLIWNCRNCPNAMQQTFADVEMTGPDGSVGTLRLTHMVPETDVGNSLEIENANTREAFQNLQKTSTFAVRIHEGDCATPGEQIHSVNCRGCQNSMGIKILEGKKKLTLAGDGSDSDIVGKAILFYDTKKNAKLACGEVALREEA